MIIAVNNNKGGVLKTTTVTNLASVLSKNKKKVLIVDADNQSNASLSFGLNPDKFRTTIYDVLVDNLPPEDAIVKIDKYIDLLPSNLELVSFEFDVIGNIVKYPEPFQLMKKSLHHLEEKYEFILIDTPPSLGLMNGNVFTFADKVIIPFEPEAYSMRSVMSVVQTVQDFQEELNPELEIIGLLRTKYIWNSNLHIGVTEEIKKYADKHGISVFETEIPRTVEYANAVGFDRKPIAMLKKNAKGKLYFALWEEIEERLKVKG